MRCVVMPVFSDLLVSTSVMTTVRVVDSEGPSLFPSSCGYPPPFVIATPKYGINTVPTPTVAITRAWLAHDTYNYQHTRERMHGMSAPPAPGMGMVIG